MKKLFTLILFTCFALLLQAQEKKYKITVTSLNGHRVEYRIILVQTITTTDSTVLAQAFAQREGVKLISAANGSRILIVQTHISTNHVDVRNVIESVGLQVDTVPADSESIIK